MNLLSEAAISAHTHKPSMHSFAMLSVLHLCEHTYILLGDVQF